jgi:hypothetical protein
MRVYVILEFTDADLVTPALNLTLTSGENLVREIARADSLADLVNAVEEHAVIAELSETKAAAFRYGTPDLVAVPARSRLRAFRDDKPPLAVFDPEDAVEGMRAQLAPPTTTTLSRTPRWTGTTTRMTPTCLAPRTGRASDHRFRPAGISGWSDENRLPVAGVGRDVAFWFRWATGALSNSPAAGGSNPPSPERRGRLVSAGGTKSVRLRPEPVGGISGLGNRCRTRP